MSETKRGRGRPATLTEEGRQAQLREAKAAHRARASNSGKTRLEATVDIETKKWLEEYVIEHGLPSLGAALDALKKHYTKKS